MTPEQELLELGFCTFNKVYSDSEIEQITTLVNSVDQSELNFRKTNELFAIRQFLLEVPSVQSIVFNENLKAIIKQTMPENCFVVKSIYFDKPEQSNWFVAYHQDLSIAVNQKVELPEYGPWTKKHNQFGVQPPLNILNSIYTIRIHLDDTTGDNGALKVIPGSQKKGVYRPETIDWQVETETTCEVPKGGIMMMRPLLLHSSSRSKNNNKRRVIHIELSNAELPKELQWAERMEIN